MALVASTVSPASANHKNGLPPVYGHWGNGYSPPVYTNLWPWTILPTGQEVGALIQDAGYFWQGHGFTQGWNPGAFPGYSTRACDQWIDGAIYICFVPWNDPTLNVGGFQAVGAARITTFGRCDTACNHIYAARVSIAYDAQGAAGTQITTRHELGHALGLAHNEHSDSYASVMAATPTTPYATNTDYIAMLEMYPYHSH
jgi:hypothetical protein